MSFGLDKKRNFLLLCSLDRNGIAHVGDVVLVQDYSMRNKWPMAKVIMTYPDKKCAVATWQIK